MSHDFYYAFSEKFRGSRELIKQRLRAYLPFIEKLKQIYQEDELAAIDLGCGRGEWLELLKETGIAGIGVDMDERMLTQCHELGLSVHVGDALAYLKSLPDESQVVVSGFHIVEHIPFEALQGLVSEALRVLKPAGLLILETPNPENLLIASANFYLDPTHQKPIPPHLLAFLPEYYQFARTKIVRLQETFSLSALTAIKLEDVIMGVSPDYAVVAQKQANSTEMALFDKLFQQEYGLTLHAAVQAYDLRMKHKNPLLVNYFIIRGGELTKGLLRKIKLKAQRLYQYRQSKKKQQNAPQHIAIDLTPVLPGGENGGAKVMTIELIKSLSQKIPGCRFLLLTTDKNHDELAYLDAHNVRRLMSTSTSTVSNIKNSILKRIIRKLRALSLTQKVFSYVSRIKNKNNLLKKEEVDLLFCPFTEPFYFHPDIPVVSVIYDLQHCYYPQFFSGDEVYARNRYLKKVGELATRIICISHYVRQTILEHLHLAPKKVITSHIRLYNRLENSALTDVQGVLQSFNLKDNAFILYPANFWPHKNHLMLFTAFGMFRARQPDSILKLVCTGATNENLTELRRYVTEMGLSDWVIFPDYVSNPVFSVLLNSTRALFFPSLYEGFGMPILEAMLHKKPVFCSNVTSLPEVGCNAAHYFDPRKPEELVDALSLIENEPNYLAQLVERGVKHVQQFGTPDDMAMEYWAVFCDAFNNKEIFEKKFTKSMEGVYPDQWLSGALHITYEPVPYERTLEFELEVPVWAPKNIKITEVGHKQKAIHEIKIGEKKKIIYPLSSKGGAVKFIAQSTFQPKLLGISEDYRHLAGLIHSCRIVSATESYDFLTETC